MPKVKLSHHGQGFDRCGGANRVTRARVEKQPHPRSYDKPEQFGGKTVLQAWCRWCSRYVYFDLVEEKGKD